MELLARSIRTPVLGQQRVRQRSEARKDVVLKVAKKICDWEKGASCRTFTQTVRRNVGLSGRRSQNIQLYGKSLRTTSSGLSLLDGYFSIFGDSMDSIEYRKIIVSRYLGFSARDLVLSHSPHHNGRNRVTVTSPQQSEGSSFELEKQENREQFCTALLFSIASPWDPEGNEAGRDSSGLWKDSRLEPRGG